MAVVREKEIYGKCKSCGGDIIEWEKSWFCTNSREGGCKVHLPKRIMGVEITKEMAREFFGGRYETDEFEGVTREGKEVKFRMAYSKEEKDVVPVFGKVKQEPIGKCPVCVDGEIYVKGGYFCSNYKSEPACGFRLYKEMYGAKFTDEMVRKLIAGEILKDVECETKEGKKYKSNIRIGTEGENRGDLILQS